MSRKQWVAAALAGATVAAGVSIAVPSVAGASTAGTISSTRHHVLHNDPVTLTGSVSRTLPLYRSLNGHRYARIGWVHSSHGRYKVTVRPIAGYLNRYKVGTSSDHVNVQSTACAPLATLTGPQTWFNVRNAGTSTLGSRLTGLICAAAPHSTVELSVMNLSGGSTSANRFVAALRNAAHLRGVHVDVVVRSRTFPTRPTAGWWTLAQFRAAFSFASVHTCLDGCTTSGPTSGLHYKFLTIDRLTDGGSAVVASSLNVTPQQLDRQNGSAIYIHDDAALHSAFHAAHVRAVRHTPLSAGQQPVGWHYTSRGVSYAFDPSTPTADPVTNELGTLTCRPGDFVEVINANVSRSRLVGQLNRLQAAGCAVRVVTEQSWVHPLAQYRPRHAYTHDRVTVVHAHTSTGAVCNEVLAGSELYRPSGLQHEEQLLRVRSTAVTTAYSHWFDYMWAHAG